MSGGVASERALASSSLPRLAAPSRSAFVFCFYSTILAFVLPALVFTTGADSGVIDFHLVLGQRKEAKGAWADKTHSSMGMCII